MLCPYLLLRIFGSAFGSVFCRIKDKKNKCFFFLLNEKFLYKVITHNATLPLILLIFELKNKIKQKLPIF